MAWHGLTSVFQEEDSRDYIRKIPVNPVYCEGEGCEMLFYEKTPLSGDKDAA
jgi:hypothetical protein